RRRAQRRARRVDGDRGAARPGQPTDTSVTVLCTIVRFRRRGLRSMVTAKSSPSRDTTRIVQPAAVARALTPASGQPTSAARSAGTWPSPLSPLGRGTGALSLHVVG